MTYDEMKASIQASVDVMRQSQYLAKQAFEISRGRLRHMYLDADTLRDLKRELQDFNAITGHWK